MSFRWLRALVLLSLCTGLQAQQAGEAQPGKLTFHGSVRSRLEAWDWFGDQPGNRYTYSGSTLRFSVGQSGTRWEWLLDLEAPVLLGLPERSIAAGALGQLGTGASYYAANQRHQNAAMLFPKQGFVRWKGLFGQKGHWLKLGRFEFNDGSELTSRDATLTVLKRDRIQQRLIGTFGWTHVGRSFDGVHYGGQFGKTNLTFVGAVPTRGVFQVDGWGEVKTAFGYVALSRPFQGKHYQAEGRLFGLFYDDFRRGVLKTDNRAVAARQADGGNVRIATFGGHWVQAIDTPAGTFDQLLWFAGQTGRWGSLDHRALAFSLEGGWQPVFGKKLRPWMRAGWAHGSGDKDVTDGTHGTFFQVLPTPRPYAKTPFYNMSNLDDRFVSLSVRPRTKLTLTTEYRALTLAQRNDLWYSGGGAFQPWTFGYQGRASNGAASLANLLDASFEWALSQRVSVNGYYGHAFGKQVVRAIYGPATAAQLGYLELVFRY